MIPNSLGSSPELVRLQSFRETLYSEVLTRQQDALLELLDALLELGPVSSFVELSQSPFFRREWPSVYAAVDHGRIDPQARRGLSLEHPLDQKRVLTSSNNLEVLAAQFREGAPYLPGRGVGVLDSEMGNGTFLDLLAPLPQPLSPNAKQWTVADPADCPVDVLARLAGNRTFYRRPPAYSGQGRPRVHGAAFRMQDESTWPEPDREEWIVDRRWGLVHLRAWDHLHSEDHPWREVTIVLVERSGASGSRRQPKRMWLMWYGINMPSLETLWRWYERRFTVEHWHRFGQQTLNWTRPHLGAPERLDRWGQVVMLATWELWLARSIPVGEVKRWQKRPADAEGRTPGQVRQGMRELLGVLGTPAKPPPRRGRSAGRRKGQCPGRKPRYKVVKKGWGQRSGSRGTQTATAQTA